MMQKATEVICALRGRTLVTAESCTGGMIGSLLTAVPGASLVYKGGVISYCDAVKNEILCVPDALLKTEGAVSAAVAAAMAEGAAKALKADVAVSVTGLAGPSGDEFGNPVGRVYIGYFDMHGVDVREFTFSGDREAVRQKAALAALEWVLDKALK